MAPRPGNAIPERSSSQSAVAAGEATARVLADVNHELGNYFHKLYYWGDAVCELAAGKPGDGIAPELLGQTLRGLESFLRAAFAHFEPVELAPIVMPIADVTAAIGQRLRIGVPTATVAAPGCECADARVALDPGRISAAVEVIARRCHDRMAPTAVVSLAIERLTPPAVAFHFTVAPARPLPAATVASSLEWMKTQQVVALHGGSLSETDRTDGSWIVTMQLPL